MPNHDLPNSKNPDIRTSAGIELPPQVISVLQTMFPNFWRIAVEAKLDGGFSGSYIYRVRLVRADHQDELAVVKVAPVSLIEQEQEAYKRWVQDNLPKTAHINNVSALSEDGLWKGLRYTVAGGGIFPVESLYDYYQTAAIEDIANLMEKRLFEVLGRRWWWRGRTESSFQMQTNYDDLLPLNLIIKQAAPPAQATLTLIKADNLTSPPVIAVGDWVQLDGFMVTKVHPGDGEVTLNIPPRAEVGFSPSFRVRLVGVEDIANYLSNQLSVTVQGQVEKTRHSLLESYVRQAFDEMIDPATPQLPLTTGPVFSPAALLLPNPLQTYQTLLQNFIEVRISTVHGDLNFENILIDPQIGDFILIDFATVHLGHALHDLLRLETEVVIKLIPPILQQAELPPETIFSIYEQLYLTTETDDYLPSLPDAALSKPFRLLRLIRKAARRCLIDLDNWDEYYRSLTIYLLGALKYETVRHSLLAPLPAQTAFWGAAAAQQLLQDPPDAQQTPTALSRYRNRPSIDLEAPFGTMHPDSKFYIERTVDKLCRERITPLRSATVFVQAPRQMGKSSLLQRVIKQVKDAGLKQVVFIDFQRFPEDYIEDEEEFFKELCLMIGESLNLTDAVDHYWQGRRAHILNCSRYVSRHIMPQLDQPLVLAMDEVDRMLFSPFRANFFGMLRTWHNDRAFDEGFAKLTLFLSSSTEPYLLIDDPHQSPFNVAEPFFLEDFTKSEVDDLNRRHGRPLNNRQVEDLMRLINGHPFLIRLALYLISKNTIDFNTLMTQATEDTGPFGNHLRHYLLRVQQKPDLKQALVRICRNEPWAEDQTFYRLEGAGLIKKDGQRIILRNQLYTRYFKEHFNA
ncbi:MAG: AAA-like domain-containing protein [Anaerolineae bacterium]|nr:AAA-like domain-containing protein [Anaerolineae bacterium]MCB9104545.1 AAA-like domain-containing protein [Anaerolineales bacterium]